MPEASARAAATHSVPAARWGARSVDAAIRAAADRLSPGGTLGRLSIVIFHRVHREPDPLFPAEMCAATFRERVAWLRAWFNVLPLRDAIAALDRGSLPSRALAVTFDDGYADNHDVALPILVEAGLPATFFVTAGYLDGGAMWNDIVIESLRRARVARLDLSAQGLGDHALADHASRRRAIDRLLRELKYLAPEERSERVAAIAAGAEVTPPADLMMTRSQVRALANAGMDIGAHTMTHPILARLRPGDARREIVESRERLSEIAGQPIDLFAYPNGKPGADYAREHVAAVRELGFVAAVSTRWGAARSGDPLYELPRFTPWDRTPIRFGVRMLRNLAARPEAGVQ